MVPARQEPRETSQRAKTSKCVRFSDRRGFDYKFNKSNFESEEMRDFYFFIVKCYEQVMRREEPSAVLTTKEFQEFRSLAGKEKKFQKFRSLAGSGFIQPLPLGFRSETKEDIIRELQKRFDERVKAGAVTVARNQDVNMQVKNSDAMQVDEGAEDDIGNMSEPPEDIGNMCPPDDIASLQNVARNQLDSPQGRPPTDDLSMCPYELLMSKFMSQLKRRASRFQDTGIWPKYKKLKQMFMLFVEELADRESSALEYDTSNPYLRSRLDELHTQLEDIMVEGSQNQLNKALTEDNGPGASCSHGDVQCGVKNTAITMPYDEQDGLHPNHAISKALEGVPRFTGRQRSNIADIHPQVLVSNMAGDLQNQFSKPTMECVGPQASHPQVWFPAQPSTVNERVMWAKEQQNQFDTGELPYFAMEHLSFDIDFVPI